MILIYLALIAICCNAADDFAIPPVTPAVAQQVPNRRVQQPQQVQQQQGAQMMMQTQQSQEKPIGSIAQQPVFANSVRFVQTAATAETASKAEGGTEDKAKKAEEKAEAKLKEALSEIKVDVVKESHRVIDERNWIKQVEGIIQKYQGKIVRVRKDVDKLRGHVRTLYKKQRQIQNLMLQKRMEAKLKDAQKDLETINSALKNVKQKADTFNKHGKTLKGTITDLKTALGKLQGKSPEDAAEEKDPAEVKKEEEKEANPDEAEKEKESVLEQLSENFRNLDGLGDDLDDMHLESLMELASQADPDLKQLTPLLRL